MFSSDCTLLLGTYADILRKFFGLKEPERTKEKNTINVLNTKDRKAKLTDEPDVEEATT